MLLDVGGLSQKYSKKDIIKRRMFMRKVLKAAVCLGLSLTLGFSTVAFGAEKKEDITSKVGDKKGQVSSEIKGMEGIQDVKSGQVIKAAKKSKGAHQTASRKRGRRAVYGIYAFFVALRKHGIYP